MLSELNKYEDLYSKCINNFWHLVGHILEIPKQLLQVFKYWWPKLIHI